MGNETGQLDMRPLLLKRFVWDTSPHDYDEIVKRQRRLGLIPDDEGGLDVEHVASDMRRNRVAPLDSTLRTLSNVAASVVTGYFLGELEDRAEENEEPEIPEGLGDELVRQNDGVIYASACAIFCHLMDTGVIEYGSKLVRGMAGGE